MFRIETTKQVLLTGMQMKVMVTDQVGKAEVL